MAERKRRERALLYDEPLPADAPECGQFRRRNPDELSHIEIEFCYRWTACYTPVRAAIEAGYNPASAYFAARRLLANPRVKQQIALIEADRLRRLKFDGDKFLAQELLLAEADMTELQEVWVPPCRFCWGRNHEYQRTHAEFQEDFEAWMRLPDKHYKRFPATGMLSYGEVLIYGESERKLPFDEKGGDGYDVEQPPNPACPNCHGRGLEVPGHGSVLHIKQRDTRELSAVGKLLFAGAKHGAHGVEVLARKQDAARGRIMDLIGKFLELRASGHSLNFGMGIAGNVAALLTNDPRSMTDQQLDVFLASHGVVLDNSEFSGREEADSGGDPRKTPPPGYIA